MKKLTRIAMGALIVIDAIVATYYIDHWIANGDKYSLISGIVYGILGCAWGGLLFWGHRSQE